LCGFLPPYVNGFALVAVNLEASLAGLVVFVEHSFFQMDLIA